MIPNISYVHFLSNLFSLFSQFLLCLNCLRSFYLYNIQLQMRQAQKHTQSDEQFMIQLERGMNYQQTPMFYDQREQRQRQRMKLNQFKNILDDGQNGDDNQREQGQMDEMFVQKQKVQKQIDKIGEQTKQDKQQGEIEEILIQVQRPVEILIENKIPQKLKEAQSITFQKTNSLCQYENLYQHNRNSVCSEENLPLRGYNINYLCESENAGFSGNIENSFLQEESFAFNQSSIGRFNFLIWGKDHILKNVSSFQRIFQQIKYETGINDISLNLDIKMPKMLGALFQINDKSQHKKYKATLLLIACMQQFQKSSISLTQYINITILAPTMLVPVMMGKQGKIINKIKKLTNCSIMVHGPYDGYNYQNIEIGSINLENIAKTCFLIYNTVYKVLIRQSIYINQCITDKRQKYCKLGIVLKQRAYRRGLMDYQRLVKNNQDVYQIEVKIKKQRKYQQLIIYKIQGNLYGVQKYIRSILEIITFSKYEEKSIKIIITNQQAKNIKSLSGKILRDISSKAQYCYIEIKQKDDYDSILVIEGSIQSQIKTICLVCEFLCYQKDIIKMCVQRIMPNYQQELDKFQNPAIFQNKENFIEVNCEKKKKIKKKKKCNKSQVNFKGKYHQHRENLTNLFKYAKKDSDIKDKKSIQTHKQNSSEINNLIVY